MEASTLLTTLFSALFVYYVVQRYMLIYHTLTDIPTVGASGFFSTYAGTMNYIFNAPDLLEEGYIKYRDHCCKVYSHEGWVIITGGKERLDDIRKASDEQLSAMDAINDIFLLDYTVGPEIVHDPYHIKVVQGVLNRNIATQFPDIEDEIIAASADVIPLSDEWVQVKTFPAAMEIVVRAANRFWIGLPLCRDRDYLDMVFNYSTELVVASWILKLFPKLLRPLALKVFTRTNTNYEKIKNHLEPMLQYRLDQENKFGKHWEGRPNDFISWLLDMAEGPQRSIRDLTLRMVMLNFAATHATTVSLTYALHDLASNPQYIEPLREEIEVITRQQGWSKKPLGQMRKLDSFLKESQRFWGSGAVAFGRTALKEYTFSNGQTIPAGHSVYFYSQSTHFDKAYYDNPHEFQPFRFLHMGQEGGHSVSQLFTTPGPSWVLFGIGRHACPGRFLASTEVTLAFAHILLNYDVKLENDAYRPQNKVYGMLKMHDTQYKLLWRKRRPVAA